MSELPSHDQLLDLLAKQATHGLTESEATELQLLLSEHPEVAADEFEASVAAILLGSKTDHEAMPTQLAAKILADAPVSTAAGSANIVALQPRKPARFASAGWWAAAASLLIAVAGWWPRLNGELVARPPAVAALTPEQQRANLLNSGHAIQASWSPGNDAAADALVGDVVFDPVTQKGYLRFRGIPANDPRLEQYQLWIADADRKPPEPVDGGVFNTPQNTATGDVIIPFEAKLPVGKPAAFVVTVEQPGGVVVSKQEHVLALAKVTS
jgi:Anti-sigma-K factor rskA, C-terminal